MFVIIKNGGKQYKVQSGDIVKLDYLGEDKGKKLSIKEVLACNLNNKDIIGKPYLDNVEVKIEILENKKDKKVLVFKKRRRHNSRRLNGHRQSLSVVKISDILLDGKSIDKENKTKIKTAETKKSSITKNNEVKAKQKVVSTEKIKEKKE
mgnify:FL=1|tara:strand:- start:5657 stop:6106 length:450 start_codon:yes stop_codon:yes gene_type:complete